MKEDCWKEAKAFWTDKGLHSFIYEVYVVCKALVQMLMIHQDGADKVPSIHELLFW